MDFLNKAVSQLTDFFRSMTPGARITAGLLLAVVVISLVYLFGYRGYGPDLYLMNGEQFPASRLPAMEAAFAKASLNSYQFEGNRIRIPRGQQNAYMAALAENNAMPEDYSRILDKALEGANPWVDRQQREQLIKAAKQKQLELIIKSMKGIQNAFVMYDTETKRGFNKEPVTTASVNVQPLGSPPLTESQVLGIRTLVGRAVAGLQPESVAVTDLSTGRTFSGGGDGAANALEDPYGSRKRMYEQQWKEKVLEALSYVPGVTVTANVELDKERSHRKELLQHEPKGVPLQTIEKSRTSNSEGSGPGGRPGYTAQQPPNTSLSLGASSAKGSREDQEESESQTVNLVGQTRDISDAVGLTPKRVTLSIGIPWSYFQKVWQERNPAAAGGQPKAPDQAALDQIRTEETTKIKEHVAKLLPPVDGVTDPGQLVQVTPFQDLKPPEIPQPGMKDTALVWLAQYWSTLGMIGLAGVSLLILRSMIRSTPAPAGRSAAARTRAQRVEAREVDLEEGPQEQPAKPRLRRFSGSGPSLRDELSGFVQEDPDAAANVLRAWIGSTTKP